MGHGSLRSIRFTLPASVGVLLACTLATADASTQSTSGEEWPSRAQLQARLDSLYDLTGSSSRSSGAFKDLQARISYLERRLEEGDFRVGDVVDIRIAGDTALSGTYTVGAARQIQFSRMDDISLQGVLYSEAEEAISNALSQYYRDPRMQVRVLKRVAVLGAVRQPGFYSLPPSASVAELLMTAGGPTQNANLNKVKLQRGDANLLNDRDEEMETLTLQQLGVQRGDRFLVPAKGSGVGFREILGITSGVAGLAFIIQRLF